MKKIAIITGGSRGLGKNMAIALAKKNINVILTYNSKKEEAVNVVQEIEKLGAKAAAIQLNVAEVKTFDNCGEYYELAKKAINSAKKRFEDDVLVALLEKYKSNKPNYMGDLGRLQFVASIPATTNVQYLKISPKNTQNHL